MQKNVGTNDRIVRAIVGVVLVVMANFFVTGWVMWLLWAFGVILLITAALGYCHIYTLLGISTVRHTDEQQQ